MADSVFNPPQQINCKGKLLSLEFPIVMGIINVTPDSFYENSRQNTVNQCIIQCEKLLNEGATIIDIGGYSSKPGSELVTEEVEIKRVIPVIEALHVKFPEALFSIDTFRSEVAKQAIAAGASIVNDISAGDKDVTMFDFIIASKTPYIMMHMKGTPQTMQENPVYEDVVMEVTSYFSEKINYLQQNGVSDLIIDLGFGFGKTVAHNYELLANLDHFKLFNLPILAGLSRKSMLYKPLGLLANEALNATTVANTLALANGANLLRVHDVKEAIEAVKIFKLYRKK